MAHTVIYIVEDYEEEGEPRVTYYFRSTDALNHKKWLIEEQGQLVVHVKEVVIYDNFDKDRMAIYGKEIRNTE